MKWIVSNKNSPMWVFNANEEVTTAVIQYADGVASNACVNGQKRFYLVQKDSKYDKRNGFSVILK